MCAAGGRLCSLPTCPALLPALAACRARQRARGRGPRCTRAWGVARSAAGGRRARSKRGWVDSGAGGARGGARARPVDGQVYRERARAHAASLRPRALLTTAGRIQLAPQAASAGGLTKQGSQSAQTSVRGRAGHQQALRASGERSAGRVPRVRSVRSGLYALGAPCKVAPVHAPAECLAAFASAWQDLFQPCVTQHFRSKQVSKVPSQRSLCAGCQHAALRWTPPPPPPPHCRRRPGSARPGGQAARAPRARSSPSAAASQPPPRRPRRRAAMPLRRPCAAGAPAARAAAPPPAGKRTHAFVAIFPTHNLKERLLGRLLRCLSSDKHPSSIQQMLSMHMTRAPSCKFRGTQATKAAGCMGGKCVACSQRTMSTPSSFPAGSAKT